MPARKPAALQQGHDTNAEKDARQNMESLAKTLPVSKTPPRELRGFEIARRTWRTIVGDFLKTEGMELDKLDKHILLDLCLAEEEMVELMKMRVVAFRQWEANNEDIKSSKASVARLVREVAEEFELSEARRIALGFLKKNQELYKTILSLDARIDQKKKLKVTYYQSLYLTPRARAGAHPSAKKDERNEPLDPMEALLSTPVGQFQVMTNTRLGSK